jgi:hypothetical protein
MIIPSYDEILKRNHYNKNYISKNYPDFYHFIIDKYSGYSLSLSEMLYWYFNDLSEHPKCKICEKKVKFKNIYTGYCDFCSHKCCSIGTRQKAKQACLERYGVENYTNPEKRKQTNIERYGVDCYTKTDEYITKSKTTYIKKYGEDNFTKTEEYKIKRKQTSLEKYGVSDYSKSDIVIDKIKKTRIKNYGTLSYINLEKQRQTCLERYGVDSYSKTKEYIQKRNQTNIERYGFDCYTKTEEYKIRSYKTKKQNNTFNSSSIEKQFEAYLKENNINYKTQYKSEVYPFSCDFYFPDYNMYLEINAHWTHGGHPFDSTNKDDILLLEQWKSKNTKFYDIAINTWTVRDVLKRETAKKNNLNYIEVFSNKLDKIIDIISYIISK